MTNLESEELRMRQSILYAVGRICDAEGRTYNTINSFLYVLTFFCLVFVNVGSAEAKLRTSCATCPIQRGHGINC